MKKSRETETGKALKTAGKYSISEAENYWIASANSTKPSGSLSFNKRTQRYNAKTFSTLYFLFPKLAKGYVSNNESPINKNHLPKSDFLLLLALRERMSKIDNSEPLIESKWRQFAFKMRRMEAEAKSGKKLSESNRSRALEIANSHDEFEIYTGKWLSAIAEEEGAGDKFRRLANWLDAAERIETEELPPQYAKFLSAVETAATRAHGIPKQKDVREVYEKGLSDSQLGGGYGFDGLKKQLGFSWLPASGRGKATIKNR